MQLTEHIAMSARQPAAPAPEASAADAALSALARLADAFEPIALEDMRSVALLDRVDTKFVLSLPQLMAVLGELRHDYHMLVVQGERLNAYRTLYFDTPAFDLFTAHANKRGDRYKVRAREYLSTHVSFLEVKHKTHKDRTIKDRVMTGQPVTRMTPEWSAWLQGVAPVDGQALEPKLWNTFRRMTLVSVSHGERVTIDVDLAFSTPDRRERLDGLAIVEVKRAIGGAPSPFLAQMRACRIQRRSFSKYSIGVGLLVDHVKKNTLKQKLLWLRKALRRFSEELNADSCSLERHVRAS